MANFFDDAPQGNFFDDAPAAPASTAGNFFDDPTEMQQASAKPGMFDGFVKTMSGIGDVITGREGKRQRLWQKAGGSVMDKDKSARELQTMIDLQQNTAAPQPMQSMTQGPENPQTFMPPTELGMNSSPAQVLDVTSRVLQEVPGALGQSGARAKFGVERMINDATKKFYGVEGPNFTDADIQRREGEVDRRWVKDTASLTPGQQTSANLVAGGAEQAGLTALSLGANLPATVGGKIAQLAGTMALPSTAKAYDQLSRAGLSGGTLVGGAISQGLADAVPEAIPMGVLAQGALPTWKAVRTGLAAADVKPLVQMLKYHGMGAAAETLQEYPSTAWNWINDYLTGDPTATLDRLGRDLVETTTNLPLQIATQNALMHGGRGAVRMAGGAMDRMDPMGALAEVINSEFAAPSPADVAEVHRATGHAIDTVAQPAPNIQWPEGMQPPPAGGMPIEPMQVGLPKGPEQIADVWGQRGGNAAERTYVPEVEKGKRQMATTSSLDDNERIVLTNATAARGVNADEAAAEAMKIKLNYPAELGWVQPVVSGISPDGDNLNDRIEFQKVPYTFHIPPGKTRAPNEVDQAWSGEIAKRMTDEMIALTERAKTDPVAKQIIDHMTWYREMARRLRSEFGGFGDAFADLLGATSPNTPVRTNWNFSVDALRRFVRGDFDAQLAAYEQAVARGVGPEEFRKKYDDQLLRQITGKQYGINSINAAKALVGMWRAVKANDAPKARNFALNLIGQSDKATIDVWAARMLQRLAGLGRIPPKAEGAVSGNHRTDVTKVGGAFGFGQDVFEKVAQALRGMGVDVTAPDLQAVAWFMEKELWTKNGWTRGLGSEGSFEQELDKMPVERYQAGATIERSDFVPSDADMVKGSGDFTASLAGDAGVITYRSLPTTGMYAGSKERSFDTEVIASAGWDPSAFISDVARTSKAAGQIDAFVSRVLQPNEQSSNWRPGIELYFKTAQDAKVAEDIINQITKHGIDGFTLIKDPLERRGMTGANTQKFIGLRLQYVPEIHMRWADKGDPEVAILTSGDQAAIEQLMQDKMRAMTTAVDSVADNVAIAHSAVSRYDTLVIGQENYDEYIGTGQAASGASQGNGGFFGQLATEVFARAAARLGIEPSGNVGADDVSGRGKGLPREELNQGVQRRPSWYYSTLENAVRGMPAKVSGGPAGAVANWLRSNAGKLGIKQEELQWSGVFDYLAMRGADKITAAELADWVANNNIKVNTVTLDDGDVVGPEDVYHDMPAGRFDVIEVADGLFDIRLFNTLKASDLDAQEVADFLNEENEDASNRTQFGSYVLPGGTGYKEILITIPEKPKDTTTYPPPRTDGNFRSSHFKVPNILAHIRFNERTDSDGKRVLFIEEIQSDWGQKGKKEGFANPDSPVYAVFAKAGAFLKSFERKADAESFAESVSGVVREEKRQAGDDSRPPSAPFVTDTKSWTTLALKRAIAYAVDNGFDKIAWTTGEQQASRYDLSKQVDSISYSKRADGWAVDIRKDGKSVWASSNTNAAEIESVAGKEIAKKIEDGAGHEVGAPSGSGELSGLNLKVGGEGMKGFYDAIVPQVAKKLGAEVGEVQVSAPYGSNAARNMATNEFRQSMYDKYGDGIMDKMSPEERRQLYAIEAGRVIDQPGFTIPEAMREQVKAKGMPLFVDSYDGLYGPYAIQPTMDGSVLDAKARQPKISERDMARRQVEPLTADQFRTVNAALSDLASAGLPTSWMNGVTYYGLKPVGAGYANYNPDDSAIAVDWTWLDKAKNDTKAQINIRGWLAHELHHRIDNYRNSTTTMFYLSAESPRMDITITPAGRVTASGDLMNEAYSLWLDGGELTKYLNYPFQTGIQIADDPGRGVDYANQFVKVELFAQMGALWTTNPELVKQLAPKWAQFFKEWQDARGTGTVEQSRLSLRALLHKADNQANVDGPVGRQDQRAADSGQDQRSLAVAAAGPGVGPVRAAVGKSGGPARLSTPEEQARAAGFLATPAAPVPAETKVGKLNYDVLLPEKDYRTINSPDELKATLSRLTELHAAEIEKQRRGVVGHEQTYKEAEAIYSNLTGVGGKTIRSLMQRTPGTAAGAGELIARRDLMMTATDDLRRQRDALADKKRKGQTVTPEEHANFIAAMERGGMVIAMFMGARAEAGRALEILKETKRMTLRAQAIQELITQYNGPESLDQIVDMMEDIDNPAQLLAAGLAATNPTIMDALIELWKNGLLSGPTTHLANILGNTTYMALRIPQTAIAGIFGKTHWGTKDKVYFGEAFAQAYGIYAGTIDALRAAGEVFRDPSKNPHTKLDNPHPEAFTGRTFHAKGRLGRSIDMVGHGVRVPYRMLGTADAFFRSMNGSMSIHAGAVRQTLMEGKHYWQKDFMHRAAQLASEARMAILVPGSQVSKEAQAIADEALEDAEKYTFNEKGGVIVKNLLQLRRDVKALSFIMPFISTPAAILRKSLEMTPAAPISAQWRKEVAAGGHRRDTAFAQVATGAAIALMVMSWANIGMITGGGSPEPEARRRRREAGIPDYSIKLWGKWHEYRRLEPLGTLMGMAADAAEVHDYAMNEQGAHLSRMVAMAFAQAVTSKTFWKGMSDLANVFSDPGRYGEGYIQSYAGSLVPGIIAQTASHNDRIVRDRGIYGMEDATFWEKEAQLVINAVKARIPKTSLNPEFNSESLPAKKDTWGEDVKSDERLFPFAPIRTGKTADDPVRLEAYNSRAKLGMPAKEIEGVKLDPDTYWTQYAGPAGQYAHKMMSKVVESPQWKQAPPFLKQEIFEDIVKMGRELSADVLKARRPEIEAKAMDKLKEQINAEPNQPRAR